MTRQPPRILILSHGKSGSTGLYFKIKNSLEGTVGVFEPRAFDRVTPHLSGADPLLVKALVPDATPFLPSLIEAFPMRILLVRDLRDVLVSALLYLGGYEILWNRPDGEIEAALSLLRRKQHDPRCISLVGLFRGIWGEDRLHRLFDEIPKLSRLFVDLAACDPAFFVCRYEDFIEGRLESLENHLGFPLNGTAEVASNYRRVVRTRGSGSWRDWFLPEDVKVFKPLLKEYMVGFGYDWRNWDLSADPRIEGRHAVAYLKSVIEDRRRVEGAVPR